MTSKKCLSSEYQQKDYTLPHFDYITQFERLETRAKTGIMPRNALHRLQKHEILHREHYNLRFNFKIILMCQSRHLTTWYYIRRD